MELPRDDLFKGGGVKSGVAVRMTEPAFDCPSINEAAADGSFMLQVRETADQSFYYPYRVGQPDAVYVSDISACKLLVLRKKPLGMSCISVAKPCAVVLPIEKA